MKIDSFMKLVVLGRNVERIGTDKDGNGVDVLFKDGDTCYDDFKYKTEIRFRCIVEDEDVTDDFMAEKLEYVGTEGDECLHIFAWHTSLACPVCRKNQVVETRGECKNVRPERIPKRAKILGDNGRPLPRSQLASIVGVRKVVQQPAPGEMCYIPYDEKLAGPDGDIDPQIYSVT